MLRTEAIAKAFDAIVEEAERLSNLGLPEAAKDHVKTIISIAKHQNDIRDSPKGSCKANEHP